MIEALMMMGGLGLVVGFGLAIASKVFYVYVDPKVMAVDEILPGANCGGCGYPGCSANAEAIVAGKASPNSCVAAGSDVAEAIAAVLGVALEAKEPDIAKPGCYYGVKEADSKYTYTGLSDCRAAAFLAGGMKVCEIGCLGLGSCVKACPFDALSMGPDGLPVVDEEKCTGCGTCERVCPKHIITLSSVTRRILKEYTVEDCTTPCQRACPAGINIREYIRRIQVGDYKGSLMVIRERNPFPSVIGRICPRPCEDECRRVLVDEPVAINFLKRFAADFEKNSGKHTHPYVAPPTGKKVAVVGGGVEGLSTAFFLTRLGHKVTLYEASPHLGGILRTAIADYRLPMDILDWDIEGILEMGVEAKTSMKMGTDFTLDSLLKEDHEAVFLATGGWDSRLTRTTQWESPVPGVFLLVDLAKSMESKEKMPVSGKVLIYGGGETAVKTALLLREQGIKEVTLVFRKSKAEVKQYAPSFEAAENDPDIKLYFKTAVQSISGNGDRLARVILSDPGTRKTETIPADALVLSSGRFPEMVFSADSPQPVEEEEEKGIPKGPVSWHGCLPYKPPQYYSETGMFAQGDPVTDYSAAIRAIGGGRRGAASVHAVLYNLSVEIADNVVHKDSDVQHVNSLSGVKPVPREIMPVNNLPDPATGRYELEKGFSEENARKESNRCLQCGLICYVKTGSG